jgi:hypothetical protein
MLAQFGAVGLAFADPTTYVGKLGKADIAVEFTEDPSVASKPVAARYFYLSQGIDIPLQPKSQGKGNLELAEEEACGTEKCGDGRAAPTAAVWRLASKDGGKTLTGTWNAKKSLPVSLTRMASRPQPRDFPETPLGLYDFSDETFYPDGTAITKQNSPYDYIRLDVPVRQGKKQGWPGAYYNYVSDPRTVFEMPRLVELADGVAIEPANKLLQERQWQQSRAALSCAALRYRGFHEDAPLDTMDDGTLGGYDETTSEVTYLSPSLMSWTESGSVFCGGAHPTNYTERYNMDVRRGTLIGLSDIFSDTVDGKPGPSLVTFVREKRERPSDKTQIDFEAECGTDDLISDYLTVYFRRDESGHRIVFGLSGLPHVINACGDDLMSMPVAEAKHLLKPGFAKLLGN